MRGEKSCEITLVSRAAGLHPKNTSLQRVSPCSSYNIPKVILCESRSIAWSGCFKGRKLRGLLIVQIPREDRQDLPALPLTGGWLPFIMGLMRTTPITPMKVYHLPRFWIRSKSLLIMRHLRQRQEYTR